MKIGRYTKQLLREKQYKKAVVHLIIDNDWFNNKGKFKPGDKVKYNLFAYWFLKSIIPTFRDKIYTIRADKSGVEFVEGSGCDVFWLKKVNVKQ